MKIRFWGTRGSIPCSLTATEVRAKIIAALQGAKHLNLDQDDKILAYVDSLDFQTQGSFGGHTSCVQVKTAQKEHIIFDMGSGARPLAGSILAEQGKQTAQTYHIFMSHLHWDHIMGFPFFTPVYLPGNHIFIHSCHDEAEFAFRRQMASPSFPVDFSDLEAKVEFCWHPPGEVVQIGDVEVYAKKQLHSGDSYGWRLSYQGKSLVYSTDSEHKIEDIAEREAFTEFFKAADVVIFDAMYSLTDAISVKADWGHSSNILGIELCHAAAAKQLVLFHHEPVHNDAKIAKILQQSQDYARLYSEDNQLIIHSAYDGLEIEL